MDTEKKDFGELKNDACEKWEQTRQYLDQAENEYARWADEYRCACEHNRSDEERESWRQMYLKAATEAYEATLAERAASKEYDDAFENYQELCFELYGPINPNKECGN